MVEEMQAMDRTPSPACGRGGRGVRVKPRANVKTARRLRRDGTEAERLLWQRLRARQLGGKFRRQHQLGPYVVDFACLEQGLVIELDGGQHNREPEITRDARRTSWLAANGFRVLRFWNNEVFDNIEGVLETVASELKGAGARDEGVAVGAVSPAKNPHPTPAAPGPLPSPAGRERDKDGSRS